MNAQERQELLAETLAISEVKDFLFDLATVFKQCAEEIDNDVEFAELNYIVSTLERLAGRW